MIMKNLQCVVRSPKIEQIFRRTFSSANAIQSTELRDDPNCNTRLLKVAIIGTPNAGKSTLINNIMDRKVCATSSKIHTTRGKAMAVFTVDEAQIVFMDTPGLVNDKEQKKFNLEKSFVRDTKHVSRQADLIGIIHDVTNVWTRERLDIKIIKLLEHYKKAPSFLVLNKIDILKSKRKLLDITRQVTENCLDNKPIPGNSKFKKDANIKGWPNFQEVFMTSALTGDGLSEVKNYLVKQAKPGKWLFPDQVWTDQSAEQIITNAVQAKLLDFLPQEIPYHLKPEMEYFNMDENGQITTAVNINCHSERIAKLVGGASEGKLKQITESLQQDLQNTFQNYVRVQLLLKHVKQVNQFKSM